MYFIGKLFMWYMQTERKLICHQCGSIYYSQQLHWWTDRHPFDGIFPAQPGYAGTRKVKTFWILMKQELMVWQWQWH